MKDSLFNFGQTLKKPKILSLVEAYLNDPVQD